MGKSLKISTCLTMSFGIVFIAGNVLILYHIYENFYRFAREQAQNAAKFQVETFTEAIRQDLVVGSYPGLQQKAQSYIDRFAVGRITVEDAEYRQIVEAGIAVEGIDEPVYFEKTIYARDTSNATQPPSEAFGTVKMWFSFRPLVSYSMDFVERVAPLSLALVIGMIGMIMILSRSLSKPLRSLRLVVSSQPLTQWPKILTRGSSIEEIAFLQSTLIDLSTRVTEAIRAEGELVKATAIVQTTQMLAHDVRKPFKILNFVQRRLAGVSSLAELRAVIGPTFVELDRAKAAIEGMLADLLTVNGSASTAKELASLEQILDNTLTAARYAAGLSRVEVTYRFEHQNAILVDKARIARVFTNLVCNAIEAIGGHGAIWFASRMVAEASEPMIEVTVGNSGSFIPENQRALIFDAFFTSGKQGGTGLGLAIAKKVVTDHGGEIHCRSDERFGTEFILTLPATHAPSPSASFDLPNVLVPPSLPKALPDGTESSCASTQSDQISPREAIGHNSRPLVVLVDDNPVFLDGWQMELEPHAETLLFPSLRAVEEALQRDSVILGRAVAFIIDENFEGDSETGRDFAIRLRQRFNGCIALATSDPAACRDAPGADAIWDKDDVSWPEIEALLSTRSREIPARRPPAPSGADGLSHPSLPQGSREPACAPHAE